MSLSMPTPILTMTQVSKTYAAATDPVTVLSGIDLRLDAGETLALTGESGSGKSTIIHLAAGLDTADAGEIVVNGATLGHQSEADRALLRRNHIGLVFQQFNLVPSLTVRHNIALQARLGGRFDADFADHLTARLGLSDLADRYPEQLSGGQQQRVAIARALAPRPALVLADEPTGNLDEATGDKVLDLLLELIEDSLSALLFVTHSPRLAARMTRQIHLERGKLVPVQGA